MVTVSRGSLMESTNGKNGLPPVLWMNGTIPASHPPHFREGQRWVEVPYRLGDAWREPEAGRTEPGIVN